MTYKVHQRDMGGGPQRGLRDSLESRASLEDYLSPPVRLESLPEGWAGCETLGNTAKAPEMLIAAS